MGLALTRRPVLNPSVVRNSSVEENVGRSTIFINLSVCIFVRISSTSTVTVLMVSHSIYAATHVSQAEKTPTGTGRCIRLETSSAALVCTASTRASAEPTTHDNFQDSGMMQFALLPGEEQRSSFRSSSIRE